MCRERGGKGKAMEWEEVDSSDDIEHLVLHISIFDQIKSDQEKHYQ
jgi:hypothetical protein